MFPGASTMNQLDKVVEVTGPPAAPCSIPLCTHAPLIAHVDPAAGGCSFAMTSITPRFDPTSLLLNIP